jgi:DNA mismatch repair protein MutS
VFGYYLEVTKANAKSVPADYERKQTLVNAERFTTPELKEYETKILTAQERSGEIERGIFAELRHKLLEAAGRMRETARRVAEIDMLAVLCASCGAARMGAAKGRGERGAGVCAGAASGGGAAHGGVGQRAVCAELGHMDADAGPAVLLITGPNMGGKSTYLRHGCAAGGDGADGMFCSCGEDAAGAGGSHLYAHRASDNVARGRSTFMVEMTETAAILNTATNAVAGAAWMRWGVGRLRMTG